jgi:hypothetical protein
MAFGNEDVTFDGTVELGGACFGGHVRRENGRRTGRTAAGQRTAIPTAAWLSFLQQGGTPPFVTLREAEGLDFPPWRW